MMLKRSQRGLILTIVILMLLVSGLVWASDSSMTMQTMEGKIKVLGTGAQNTYYFKTKQGEVYVLRGELLAELNLIKQFDLLLTGKVVDSTLTPIAYNIVFDPDDSDPEGVVVLGEVFFLDGELVLVTKEQFVMAIKSGLSQGWDGQKMVLRGIYQKCGPYAGEMDVIDYIQIDS